MLTKETLFRPSKKESQADETTAAAKGIIAQEKAAQDAKTERLRAARLAKAEAQPELKPPRQTKRSKSRQGD